MIIFLDTSSLFKLYHQESGTVELERLFSEQKITAIFLSEISKIEFTSMIWKKVRTKEITFLEAEITLDLFKSDFEKYKFIVLNSLIIEQARILTSKYGTQGLRTLDSLQLSCAISASQNIDLFISADKILNSLFEKEGLPNL